jgi:hypothetical protein
MRCVAALLQYVCCKTLHKELLGFTAGGSGWESSAAMISSAPRIQIVHRTDFIYSREPGAYRSGFERGSARPNRIE